MENPPPVDILENLKELFRLIAGFILSFFPSLVLFLGIVLLTIISVLLLLLTGTSVGP